jgi:uncharacterized protein (TIGR03435 family)
MKAIATLLCVALAIGSAYGQPVLPAFEVVSVRPNASGSLESNSGRVAGHRYTATNASLISLLRVAYGIQEFQIAGQPRWADVERYDIVATIPDGGRPEDWRLMLQTLLRDRFKLVTHREQRSGPIFAMMVAKSGHKLTAADPSKCSHPSGSCGFNGSPTQVDGMSVTTGDLAARLSRSIGVMVVDKTGLESKFDITLQWTVEDQFRGRGASASPTIFTAIQEQLGLRLESTTGPVDVLVINSAEKPAAD